MVPGAAAGIKGESMLCNVEVYRRYTPQFTFSSLRVIRPQGKNFLWTNDIDIKHRNMYGINHKGHFTGHYMRKDKLNSMVPLPVRRAIRKLGQDIRDARLRRRIPMAVMAERASISRTTLSKVEKGEPGVLMGHYATVLFVLGMIDRLGIVADVKTDAVGLELDEERLPKRIRRPKKNRPRRSKPRGEC